MANYFQITRPDGLGTLKLDSQGHGEVQYTVKNVGAVKIEGKAVLVSIPANAGPVEKGWVKIDGVSQRVFEVGATQTFAVKVSVPLKPAPAAGDYTFELDVVNMARPDEGDTGQRVSFTVQKDGKPAPKPFPWWIPVVALVVLAAIGGTIWYFVSNSNKGIKVPDLTGQTLSDATAALSNAGLSLDPNVATQTDTADNAGKVVAQTPAAGASAASQSQVTVTLGAVQVQVPNVVGVPLETAQSQLQAAGLVSGAITTQAVSNITVGGGFVLVEIPPAGSPVASGSSVALTVVPKTVAVPNVVGQPIGAALKTLQASGLQVGTLTGNQTTANVIAQSPASGTPATTGQQVNLTVPSTFACQPVSRCIFNPVFAQRFAIENAAKVKK